VPLASACGGQTKNSWNSEATPPGLGPEPNPANMDKNSKYFKKLLISSFLG